MNMENVYIVEQEGESSFHEITQECVQCELISIKLFECIEKHLGNIWYVQEMDFELP